MNKLKIKRNKELNRNQICIFIDLGQNRKDIKRNQKRFEDQNVKKEKKSKRHATVCAVT